MGLQENMKYKSNIFLTLLLIAFVCPAGFAQSHIMHMDHPDADVHRDVFLLMMDTMMVKMEKAPVQRSIEKTFLTQMIPHHQGAVAMSRYEIAHGKSFEMIQLAKSILAEQQSEITTMQFWLQQPESASQLNEADFSKAMAISMADMMSHLPVRNNLIDIDKAFAGVMLPHHQAAVDMAKAVLQYGKDVQTLAFAKMLISNEQIEFQQMSTYIKKQ
jgi:uncharacterized protein (DUF305 family)